MAATGFVHHIGTFLIFVACILLLITTISSPVANNISILKVTFANAAKSTGSSVTFGTFGYCVRGASNGNDFCSGKHIGYSPSTIMNQVESTGFGFGSSHTADDLTRVMILHPITCGLAFIAFLVALGAGIVGSLLASVTCAITWLLTLVVLITDFVGFGIVKKKVNDDSSGSKAEFGSAMWTLTVAMILLFIATFLVLFSCCSARRHKRQAVAVKGEQGYTGTTAHRKRFWQRSRATY